MSNTKKIARIDICKDDTIFMFNPPKLSSEIFIGLGRDLFSTRACVLYRERATISEADPFLIGELEHWKNIIYPKINKNPLVILMLQEPSEFVFENFLWVNGIRTRSDILSKVQKTKILFSDFLTNPEYRLLRNNPQWNGLLHFCDVWSSSKSISALSFQTQKKLVLERIDQAIYLGMIDYMMHSLDLFRYTFGLGLQHQVDPPIDLRKALRNHLTPENDNVLNKLLKKDYWLYAQANQIFFDRYRQMLFDLVSRSEKKDNRKQIKSIQRFLLTQIQRLRVNR